MFSMKNLFRKPFFGCGFNFHEFTHYRQGNNCETEYSLSVSYKVMTVFI